MGTSGCKSGGNLTTDFLERYLGMRNINKINVPTKVQLGAGIFLVIIMLFSACSNPVGNSTERGKVELHLDVGSRTLVSDISTQISSYRVTFSNAEGSEVSVESAETTIEASLPSEGTWDILVEGLNDSGQVVATGTSSVEVTAGETVSVAIVLGPADGNGTASFEVQWNSIQTNNPSVTGHLVNSQNETISMEFTITAAGTATSEVQVDDGYYTLEAQLLDSGVVVAGFAEAVQISAGGTTQHVFSFDTVNKPGEAFTVTSDQFTVAWNPPEDPDTGDPLSVDGYRLYYRDHGTYEWTHLVDTGSAETEFTVTTTDLSYGEYDFAVSSVSSGEESELHTSFDDTAIPSYGWYVDWN